MTGMELVKNEEGLNRQALINLVHSHQAQIYRYLRYLGAAADLAEDLMQETFVAAFRKKDQVSWGNAPQAAGWLRGAARNLFLAYCRRAKTNPVRLNSDFVERAEALWASEFADPADGSDHLEALKLCLHVLPQREQGMIELQHKLKKSRAEIAAACQLTEDGVKTLMRRIRAVLAECIQKRLKSRGEPCK
ncbi:MAG: sigma-70 family RNA polymerase sigma factor [Planctomycetes bacterium]|nr:sigma-70 family RNA polymerase sigma factor [Planctomycetota bacterium]